MQSNRYLKRRRLSGGRCGQPRLRDLGRCLLQGLQPRGDGDGELLRVGNCWWERGSDVTLAVFRVEVPGTAEVTGIEPEEFEFRVERVVGVLGDVPADGFDLADDDAVDLEELDLAGIAGRVGPTEHTQQQQRVWRYGRRHLSCSR